MNSRRSYEANQVRLSLNGYIERFKFELACESTPRHLENVAMVCGLLLEKLQRFTGETLETQGYFAELKDLGRQAHEMWSPEKAPPLAKAKPRLSVVPRVT